MASLHSVPIDRPTHFQKTHARGSVRPQGVVHLGFLRSVDCTKPLIQL